MRGRPCGLIPAVPLRSPRSKGDPVSTSLLLSAVALLAGPVAPAQPAKTAPPARIDFTLSGPYAHENLQIFLVHGPDRIKGKSWLTLAEAIDAKKVVVHETGSVNELSIENVGDDEVFVEAGEIVK